MNVVCGEEKKPVPKLNTKHLTCTIVHHARNKHVNTFSQTHDTKNHMVPRNSVLLDKYTNGRVLQI